MNVKACQLEVIAGLVRCVRDLVSAKQTCGLSWQLRNRLRNNHMPVTQVYHIASFPGLPRLLVLLRGVIVAHADS